MSQVRGKINKFLRMKTNLRMSRDNALAKILYREHAHNLSGLVAYE